MLFFLKYAYICALGAGERRRGGHVREIETVKHNLKYNFLII